MATHGIIDVFKIKLVCNYEDDQLLIAVTNEVQTMCTFEIHC